MSSLILRRVKTLAKLYDLEHKIDFCQCDEDRDYASAWESVLTKYSAFITSAQNLKFKDVTLYNIDNIKSYNNDNGIIERVRKEIHENYTEFPSLSTMTPVDLIKKSQNIEPLSSDYGPVKTTAHIIDVDYEYVNGDMRMLLYTRDVGSSRTNLIHYEYRDYFYIEITQSISFEIVRKAVNGYCWFLKNTRYPSAKKNYHSNRKTGTWKDSDRRIIENSAPCDDPFFDGRKHESQINYDKDLVYSMTVVNDLKSVYGYKPENQSFVKIVTASPTVTQHLFQGLSKKYIGDIVYSNYGKEPQYFPEMKFYEAKTDIVNKFLTSHNLAGCTAVDITGVEIKNTISTCDRAIVASSLTLNSDAPFYEPRVMFYDIECLAFDVNVFPSADICPCIQISYLLMNGIVNEGSGVLCYKETPGYEWYETEEQMLIRFAQIILDFNPDAITGFNSNNFDMPYIIDRMKVLDIYKFAGVISRRKDYFVKYNRIKKQSKQFGTKEVVKYVIPGRIMMDQFEIIKGDPTKRLRSYALKAICAEYLGDDNKEDLAYKEIPSLFKSIKGRERIASYCLQDTLLLHKIDNKMMLGITAWGMTKVLGVTPDVTLNRGLVFKLMSKLKQYTEQYNFIIPTFTEAQRPKFEGKYKGAFVLDPDVGYYEDPVVVLDFASLYPAITIAWNLCYTTIVQDKEWMKNNPDKFETHCGIPFVTHSTYKGIVPKLEEEMAHQRKAAKKKMAAAKKKQKRLSKELTLLKKFMVLKMEKVEEMDDKSFDEYIKDHPDLPNDQLSEERIAEIKRILELTIASGVQVSIYDSEQLANKIIMNSLYGMLGAPQATLPCVEIAKTITGLGRDNLLAAKDYVESKYQSITGEKENCKVIYGDSVLPDTPLLIKIDDNVQVVDAEQIGDQYGVGPWRTMYNDSDKEARELVDNVYSWTDIGWTRVYRVLRHACGKPMVKVKTPTGVVTCTIDHSLTTDMHVKITPRECKEGETRLLHKLPHNSNPVENVVYMGEIPLTKEVAMVLGMFHGNGTCYNTTWSIHNSNISTLEKYMDILNRTFKSVQFKILDVHTSSNVYKLVATAYGNGLVYFINWFRTLSYYNNGEKMVHTSILSSTVDIQQGYLEGLYGRRFDITQKGKRNCQGIYTLLTMCGMGNVTIQEHSDKKDTFVLRSSEKEISNPTTVSTLTNVTHDGYVYDLTTDIHRFHCGVGSIIGLNTDSIFIKMPGIPVIKAIHYGQKLDKRIQEDIFCHRAPMKMEYEKTYSPFIITRQKGYCGAKYEFNDRDFKVSAMGYAIVRNDSALICTKTMKAYFDYVFKDKDRESAANSVRLTMADLLGENLKLEDFVLIKKIAKAEYKTTPGHVIAWRRMVDRVGKAAAPVVGEKFEFIVTKMNKKLGIGLSDAIMDLELAKEIGFENIEIDKDYYRETFVHNPLNKIMQYIHGKEETKKILSVKSYERQDTVTAKKGNLLGFFGKQKVVTKRKYTGLGFDEKFLEDLRAKRAKTASDDGYELMGDEDADEKVMKLAEFGD